MEGKSCPPAETHSPSSSILLYWDLKSICAKAFGHCRKEGSSFIRAVNEMSFVIHVHGHHVVTAPGCASSGRGVYGWGGRFCSTVMQQGPEEPFYSPCAESSSCPEGDSARGGMGMVFLSPLPLPMLEVEAEDRPPQTSLCGRSTASLQNLHLCKARALALICIFN